VKAIEVRAVSALFPRDRELMRLWRAASQNGQVEAVTVQEHNYAVIRDDALLAYIRARYPTIDLLDFDPQSRTVS
jgi:hypothetical protein